MKTEIHEILVYRTVKQQSLVQVHTDYQPGQEEFTDLVHDKTFDLNDNEWEDLHVQDVYMADGLDTIDLIHLKS